MDNRIPTLTLFLSLLLVLVRSKTTMDSVQITYYNREYIKDPFISVFEMDDGHKATNSSIEVLQDLSMDVLATPKFYVINNSTPVLIFTGKPENMCDKEKIMKRKGHEKYFGNSTDCPVKKGTYVEYNSLLVESDEANQKKTGPMKVLLEVDISDSTTPLMILEFRVTKNDDQ